MSVSTKLYVAANPHENLGSENGFSDRVHFGRINPKARKSMRNIIKNWYISLVFTQILLSFTKMKPFC